MQAFTARRLLTPTGLIEHALMIVDEGRVREIVARGDRQLPAGAAHCDFGDGVIVPGYVDLHIHGNAGYDVMDERAGALPAIERMLARHGVTSYFPTTATAPMDRTLRALERLADAIEECARRDASHAGRCAPLGVHLEGPFISHARRGVHPPEDLLPPKVETFERFWEAARGHIRMMTLAPELEGSIELIRTAAAHGVCVSLGHSNADFMATGRAIAAGANHATHIFNAMRPLGHRDPGVLGAVLTDSRVSADIIADGVHLDPAIVKLVAQAKGQDLTVLITDATAATGMPDGRYRLGSIEVDVHDGKCTFEGKLAGSVLTMDRAVRNLSQFAGWTLLEAVAAATCNPARVVRCPDKGALRAGADADFLVLNERGEVLRTFVGGMECFGLGS
ncbi:MAG: N-acetylglucosamine-6-phosphate deacetylase [Terriglobales bacterium]